MTASILLILGIHPESISVKEKAILAVSAEFSLSKPSQQPTR
jgi:hypothetical protein